MVVGYLLVVCVAVDDCQRRLLALGLVLHASVQQLLPHRLQQVASDRMLGK